MSSELDRLLEEATERGKEWTKRGGVFRTNVQVLDYHESGFYVRNYRAILSSECGPDGILKETRPKRGKELQGIAKINIGDIENAITLGDIFEISSLARDQLKEIFKDGQHLDVDALALYTPDC